MGVCYPDCYKQTGAGVPWHGQYPQPPNIQLLTLNGKQIPHGHNGSTPFSRVGADPMSAVQIGPDKMPHVASNFHSLLPRTDMQEHFKRTDSVTIGGNTNDTHASLSMNRSSIDQQTIFGPQEDQLFRRSKYPSPSANSPLQSQLGTNLATGQSPIRQTNLNAQTTSNIPGLPIMTSRAPMPFQQSPSRNTVKY